MIYSPIMKTAIIYCRVSTEDQREKGRSLQTQLEACLGYAEQHNWQILRAVSEDHTGYQLYERPLFSAVLDDIRAGRANILLIYDVDRMTREQTHGLVIFRDVTEAGAELWFVRRGKIEDSPIGKFVLTSFTLIAEQERDSIRERTMRGKRARLAAGKIHSYGTEKYGYVRDNERGICLFNEQEAQVVRWIFQWCAVEGMGLVAIANRLNEMGIQPPAVGRYTYANERRLRWWPHTVFAILHDPRYKGEAAGLKTKWTKVGKNYRGVERPAEEHIRLPDGVVPAIVSKELWEQAQQQMASNRGYQTRNMKRPYLLRGLIFCGRCGSAMYVMRPGKRGARVRYRCASAWPSGMRPFCGARTLDLEKAEAIVWDKAKEFYQNPEFVLKEIERLQSETQQNNYQAEILMARKEIARIEQTQRRYLKEFEDMSGDSGKMIKERLLQLDCDKAAAKQRLAGLEEVQASERQLEFDLTNWKKLCSSVGDRMDSFEFADKRLTLEAARTQVTVKEGKLQIRMNPPIEMYGAVAGCSS